jgi:hypothetical protein
MPSDPGLTVRVSVAVACPGVGVRTVLSAVLPTAAVTDESVAVKITVLAPGAAGVPVIAPVVAFRLRPAGRLPEETDHV